jgi:glycosyl transferase family 25
MKVYIINMKGSERRRTTMETQLNKLKMQYEIVEAVDSREYGKDDINALIATPDTFNGGQLGCMLSHRKVYARMQEENDEYAIILEDDSLITEKQFAQLAQQTTRLLEQSDKLSITLLTYFWCREGALILHKEKAIAVGESEYFLCKAQEPWGVGRAGAYIISKEIATRLYAFNYPKLMCHADAWVVYTNNKIINSLYCVYPPPVVENPEFGSEIGYTKTSAERIIKMLIAKAMAYNIPIISSLIKKRRENYVTKYKNIIVR